MPSIDRASPPPSQRHAFVPMHLLASPPLPGALLAPSHTAHCPDTAASAPVARTAPRSPTAWAALRVLQPPFRPQHRLPTAPVSAMDVRCGFAVPARIAPPINTNSHGQDLPKPKRSPNDVPLISPCPDCRAGYGGPDGCVACPAGTYSGGGYPTVGEKPPCTACPKGERQPLGGRVCHSSTVARMRWHACGSCMCPCTNERHRTTIDEGCMSAVSSPGALSNPRPLPLLPTAHCSWQGSAPQAPPAWVQKNATVSHCMWTEAPTSPAAAGVLLDVIMRI